MAAASGGASPDAAADINISNGPMSQPRTNRSGLESGTGSGRKMISDSSRKSPEEEGNTSLNTYGITSN